MALALLLIDDLTFDRAPGDDVAALPSIPLTEKDLAARVLMPADGGSQPPDLVLWNKELAGFLAFVIAKKIRPKQIGESPLFLPVFDFRSLSGAHRLDHVLDPFSEKDRDSYVLPPEFVPDMPGDIPDDQVLAGEVGRPELDQIGDAEIEAKTGKTGILWTLHLFHIFGLKGIGRHRQCMIDLEMEGLGVSGLSDGDSLSLIIGN